MLILLLVINNRECFWNRGGTNHCCPVSTREVAIPPHNTRPELDSASTTWSIFASPVRKSHQIIVNEDVQNICFLSEHKMSAKWIQKTSCEGSMTCREYAAPQRHKIWRIHVSVWPCAVPRIDGLQHVGERKLDHIISQRKPSKIFSFSTENYITLRSFVGFCGKGSQ